MAQTTATYACNLLRKRGYRYAVVERWIPQARKRQDFCGFADILAFHPGIVGVLAVQTCAASGLSSHVRKLTSPPVLEKVLDWLEAGNRLEVWGWEKRETEYDYKPELVRVTRDISAYSANHPLHREVSVSEESEIA